MGGEAVADVAARVVVADPAGEGDAQAESVRAARGDGRGTAEGHDAVVDELFSPAEVERCAEGADYDVRVGVADDREVEGGRHAASLWEECGPAGRAVLPPAVQPLRPVEVMDRMNVFCAARKAISTGRTVMTFPAMTADHWTWCSPWNVVRPRGSV